jgi:hypothetical protein
MKIEIADATTLPEWQQGHVKDGFLDLATLPMPEDVTGLQSALSKERGNVSAYKKYGTPEQIESQIADLTEKAKGSGKGSEDAQAKLDAMKADHDTQNTAKDDRYNKLLKRTAGSDLKAELAKAGFISESIDDIASSAMGRLKFTEDGTAQVMTSDGKPMIGSGSDHGATLADLAKELATSKSYAVRDAGKGGGGKPAGSQGGTPDRATIKSDAFYSLNQADRMAFSKSGGKVED